MKTIRTLPTVVTKAVILFLFFVGILLSISSCGPEIDDPIIDYYNYNFDASSLEQKVNLNYGSNSQTLTTFISAKNHPFNNAPLVIFVPGGGYKSMTQVERLTGMAEDMARRGYKTAIVKHRVGIVDVDAYVKAIQDVHTAIRYYKANATEYGINPDQIFVAGWSTGAVTALNVAYATEEDVEESQNQPLLDEIKAALDRQGGFEGELYAAYDSEVKGAIINMGYQWDTNIIDAGEPALMLINHVEAAFQDGTAIIGTIETQGFTQWGTDYMFERAKEVGFEESLNLEYIRDEYDDGNSNFNPNIRCLTSDNYDQIARFLQRNL